MTDSRDELMKSYEVIRSIVMRHSQYDAARILSARGGTPFANRRIGLSAPLGAPDVAPQLIAKEPPASEK